MPNVIRTALSGVPVAAAFAAYTFGTAAQPAPPAIDAATRQVIDGAIDHLQCGDMFEDGADGAGDQSLYRHKFGRIAPDIAVDSAEALREAHLDALEKIRATATEPGHRNALDLAIAALEGKT